MVIHLILLCLLLLPKVSSADDTVNVGGVLNKGILAGETNGTNLGRYKQFKFSTGTTTNNADGSITVTTGAGGGSPGGTGSNLQYRVDGSTFGGVSGSSVDSNGSIGIGTSIPRALVDVTGFLSPQSPFAIDANGNVGVGTYGPQTSIQIGNNFSLNPAGVPFNGVYLGASGFNAPLTIPKISVTTSNTNLTPGTDIGLDLHNDSTTAGAYAPFLVFSRREIPSSSYKSAVAAIGARSVTGTGAGGSYIDGDLMFYTPPTAGNGLLERMRITESGNIGIGTIIPGGGLSIMNGNVGIGTWLPTSTLYFGGASTPVITSLGSLAVRGGNGNSLLLGAGPTNSIQITSVSEAITGLLTVTGNVGIGSTAPGQKLDVNGNIRVRGTNDVLFGDDNTAWMGSTAATNPGIAFNTASLQRMIIDPGGNVGIGSTNPGERLDINGNLSVDAGTLSDNSISTKARRDIGINFPANAIVFSMGNYDAMHIDSNPNVGINTAIPTTRLEVNSGADAQYYTLRLADDNGAGLRLNTNTGASNRDWLITSNFNQSGDFLIRQGTAFQSNPRSAGTDRFYIDPNGNVALADAAPKSLLSVHGNAAIGATYAGTNIAPTNGLIVQGNIGIGSVNPGVSLDITGSIRASSGTAGQTACWKADKTLGQCTTIVGAGGGCTCS